MKLSLYQIPLTQLISTLISKSYHLLTILIKIKTVQVTILIKVKKVRVMPPLTKASPTTKKRNKHHPIANQPRHHQVILKSKSVTATSSLKQSFTRISREECHITKSMPKAYIP